MRLVVSAAAVFAISVPAAAQAPDFSKVQIKTEVVAPGVAVLFGAGGNIGLSYGEDGSVLIDDQFAPLTDKILAAVAGLGAKPVKYLVNTHWHFDHTGGNENLGKAGVTIFAHENVRVRMVSGATAGVAAVPPASPATLPVVTYQNGVSFHLNGDRIDAISTHGGHTDGDTALYWRKANVLHTGDLMMNGQGFPFVDTNSGGNVLHLIHTLDHLIKVTNPQTKVIPGHGPVGTQADLIAWREMIAGAVDQIRQRKAKGQTLDAVLPDNPLKPMEKAKAFISADAFVKAIWISLDATGPKPHKH
ncbi:MBL fold metallo-hydrolase [Novosphingobium sp.]|uniref:MBL fold metallo-hydrolase n=1 Tax=Novosphingobium sp. TaxID=1874826 RepID=UPI0022C9E644|nr:MBL fold metallo-hydrolase [Novosphingobium sp.]MCZ8017319.1 MBL fold metallo-hydrolase [Novosphingobium sp.]MCZ8034158.1 MBL fold metallo-hydrolase [Novosphingobium sp.]MCZ8051513.1 MBL fold metallo-hydrolase [Novosphingobium sp.]MCZ8059859.1 MBL fold metallo-hydrolase [Novosphingobium sp.]MCZ8231697.1 MBL fold metallo-hydrolase [Novosphingobium sp.]